MARGDRVDGDGVGRHPARSERRPGRTAAPGIVDGEACNDPGAVRVERTGKHWEPLDVSATAYGPATLTIDKTTTLTHTFKLNAGVDIKVVSVSAGFDVAHAEAVAVQGSFQAPADPPGARWVLSAEVREQDHLVYACQGGKLVRVGYVGQKLNQIGFTHYEVSPTPYIPG